MRSLVAIYRRMLIRPFAALLLLAVAACDRGSDDRSWFDGGDTRTVSSSAADARLDANGRLNFEVTSDLYRRWSVAQRALGSSRVAVSIAQLGRRALTRKELDDAVARMEADAFASRALASAGLSAQEYVYATVALEQAMAVAKGRLAPRRSGVPPQNVELVRQHEAEIMGGDSIGDTVGANLLAGPDTLRPPAGDTVTPTPMPMPPVPRDPSRPAPVPTQPAPARPDPSLPIPSLPIPSPTPQPPPPPPVDTTRHDR